MAYRIAPLPMTLNNFQGHASIAGFLKCDFSNSGAVIDIISTDSASRGPSVIDERFVVLCQRFFYLKHLVKLKVACRFRI